MDCLISGLQFINRGASRPHQPHGLAAPRRPSPSQNHAAAVGGLGENIFAWDGNYAVNLTNGWASNPAAVCCARFAHYNTLDEIDAACVGSTAYKLLNCSGGILGAHMRRIPGAGCRRMLPPVKSGRFVNPERRPTAARHLMPSRPRYNTRTFARLPSAAVLGAAPPSAESSTSASRLHQHRRRPSRHRAIDQTSSAGSPL